MNGPVRPEEQITRFLVHSNEYKSAHGRPSYTAYMPDGNGEKSVYRTRDLSSEEIYQIGRTYVEPLRGPLKGHADQDASVIFNVGLSIEPAPKPHPRHANIKGWNNSRSADRILAEKIAATARLKLYKLAPSS